MMLKNFIKYNPLRCHFLLSFLSSILSFNLTVFGKGLLKVKFVFNILHAQQRAKMNISFLQNLPQVIHACVELYTIQLHYISSTE